jgi:hypothetical protein
MPGFAPLGAARYTVVGGAPGPLRIVWPEAGMNTKLHYKYKGLQEFLDVSSEGIETFGDAWRCLRKRHSTEASFNASGAQYRTITEESTVSDLVPAKFLFNGAASDRLRPFALR